MPVPSKVPAVAELYQLIVPEEQVADKEILVPLQIAVWLAETLVGKLGNVVTTT